MSPISREEFTSILSTSVIRPRLKRELRFVPGEITNWVDKDFLVVTTKSSTEGVIIPASLQQGVPFRLQARTPNSNGRVEAIICDICATWQQGTHSAVLILEKERKSLSYLVCAGLRCSLHVRGKTSESRLSRAQLREQLDEEARVKRLRSRLQQIIDDYLGM